MSTTILDLCHSAKAVELGIDNTPDTPLHFWRLERLCGWVDVMLAILRPRFPGARLSSGYRNRKVNAAVRGSKRSDHPRALCSDLSDGNTTDYEPWARTLFDRRHEMPLRPQQIIIEGDHVHVGFPDEREEESGDYRTQLLRKVGDEYRLIAEGR